MSHHATQADAQAETRNIAVLGAGSIGVAFALQFARHRHAVSVWDPAPESTARFRADLEARLALLEKHDLLGCSPADAADRIEVVGAIEDAVADAHLVQECAPENLELKQRLFAQVAELTRPTEAVLASSSSACLPSDIGRDNPAGERIIVGHPGNPPYLLPVIELVPSPRSSAEVMDRARAFYLSAGLRPVLLKREIEGFVFNRLQGALLREAYCLLRDGVADVESIDEVVRSGLGRRWSFMGPFETVDLNTRGGLEVHAGRMGPAYARMGADRGQDDPWTPELVALAVEQRRALLPLEDWDRRTLWRDEKLMRHLAAEQGEG